MTPSPPHDMRHQRLQTRAVASRPGAGPARARWTSAQLFAGGDEIEIVHGDAVYRMRITSLGKLILTK